MPTVTHLFPKHQRFQQNVLVSESVVPRRANLEYDFTGRHLTLSISPTLSAKRAYLVKDAGLVLYYKGEDPDYRFEVEVWPDNNTIKRLSVFRDDMNVEYRYISDHQDAL